jgi:hypothetical protein
LDERLPIPDRDGQHLGAGEVALGRVHDVEAPEARVERLAQAPAANFGVAQQEPIIRLFHNELFPELSAFPLNIGTFLEKNKERTSRACVRRAGRPYGEGERRAVVEIDQRVVEIDQVIAAPWNGRFSMCVDVTADPDQRINIPPTFRKPLNLRVFVSPCRIMLRVQRSATCSKSSRTLSNRASAALA